MNGGFFFGIVLENFILRTISCLLSIGLVFFICLLNGVGILLWGAGCLFSLSTFKEIFFIDLMVDDYILPLQEKRTHGWDKCFLGLLMIRCWECGVMSIETSNRSLYVDDEERWFGMIWRAVVFNQIPLYSTLESMT